MKRAAVVALIPALLLIQSLPALHADNPQPSPPPATAPAAQKIQIDNFAFAPKQLTIPAGTTVTWTNKDDVPHTATSIGQPPVFDSKALDTDDSFSFTFTTPGTYKYYCKVHPHMTGTITVK